MLNFMSILATPLGFVMQFLYSLIQNYGWTIVVFTLVSRLLMFPLSIKQQKSTARQSAYNPMIQEIQAKWKNDKQRAQQEVMKFQEENGIKMTAGCAPTILNFFLIFGIIAVIQAPLTYILKIPAEDTKNGYAIVEHYNPESNISTNIYAQQSILIGEINENENRFIEGFVQESVDEEGKPVKDEEGSVIEPVRVSMNKGSVEGIKNFKFEFMGMNLAKIPSFKSFDKYLIFPILSILTMIGSQAVVMFTSGQAQGRNSMLVMTLVSSVMFGYFAFTVPVGFSLYYTISNILMFVQQLVVKKIHNPEKIKQQVLDDIEERKKEKKAKKKVKIAMADGVVVEREINDAEVIKLRLARAREMDALKYGSEDETSENEE